MNRHLLTILVGRAAHLFAAAADARSQVGDCSPTYNHSVNIDSGVIKFRTPRKGSNTDATSPRVTLDSANWDTSHSAPSGVCSLGAAACLYCGLKTPQH